VRKANRRLPQGRHVAIDGFVYIGKESNKIEQVEEGGVPVESDVYTVYLDARRDEWERRWLPILKRVPISAIMKATGMSRRSIQRIRSGDAMPREKHKRLLARFCAARDANVSTRQ
jgi:hypothetical protein